jgi:hypothetical protein
MRVQIGPVSSRSVSAWVGYARTALDEVVTEPGGEGVWLPDDTVETFRKYLGSWEDEADIGDEFCWTADIPADEAEYLSHAFFRVASHLATKAGERGFALAPPESEAFYRALVDSFLDALDAEGDSSQEFAEHLRSFWPGLKPDE